MKKMDIYQCESGVAVETLNDAGKCVELTCCGEPMTLLEAKTEDQGKEKHVPVVDFGDDKMTVKVGEVPHPMEEDHYIQWIEVIKDGLVVRQHLQPGDEPKKEFCKMEKEGLGVRIFCNKHGLWKCPCSSCC